MHWNRTKNTYTYYQTIYFQRWAIQKKTEGKRVAGDESLIYHRMSSILIQSFEKKSLEKKGCAYNVEFEFNAIFFFIITFTKQVQYSGHIFGCQMSSNNTTCL
jgi:hypothetical protein